MADSPDAPATIPPRPWQAGVAPQYITLFLWVAFSDRLAGETLAVGGLAWSALGAAAGGLLCYLLLYYTPAMWGLAARRPLEGVAEATFGRAGARWLPGVLMGLAQVVWLAVGTFYATDYMLRGLVACRLIDPAALEPIVRGGLTLGGLAFLATALAWTLIFAAIGRWVVRFIAAIMIVYPILPALALGAAMTWNLDGLSRYEPPGLDPATALPIADAGPRAARAMIQWAFAFFATAGASAADWGAASRDGRDVRLGGLVGVALAATILAILPLATVAGSLGRTPPRALEARAALDRALVMRGSGPVVERARRDLRAAAAGVATDSTYASALLRGVGGRWAGGMLIAFALASMAPAVYAASDLGRRFAAAWPALPQTAWTFLGALAAYPLVALGVPANAGPLFTVLGAAFAPVVGAMAADACRHRGAWPGPRRGVNVAGVLAWLAGLAVGLIPIAGPALGRDSWARIQPAAVLAFGAAFLAYALVAALGLESPPAPDRPTDAAELPPPSLGL